MLPPFNKFPKNNEEYVQWYRANGINSTVGDFEKLMRAFIESTEGMKALQGGSTPSNEEIYSSRCQADLAARDLFNFLIGHSVGAMQQIQAMQEHGKAAQQAERDKSNPENS